MNYDYIGAIKIKDGLFLGDQFAAQDLEFIVTNKVSRIINCAAKQIPNHWESIGISYMSFPWMDNDQQVILQSDDSIENVMKFIDEALNNGESVIVLSVRGHNRSIAILCVYFMKKYRWTLYKTLQYMHNRRPDLEIRAHFFNQLLSIEARFQKQGFGAKTYNWDEIFTQGDNEEIILRNTYLNSQAQGIAEFKDHDHKPKETKLKFLDKVTQYVPPYDKIVFSKRVKQQDVQAKSIVKISGSSKQIDPSFQILSQQQEPQQIENSINTQKQQQQQQQQQKIPTQSELSASISKQSPLQISPLQPQRPQSQGQQQQRLSKSESLKSGQIQELNVNVQQPQRVKQNNFLDSKEQFFLKNTKQQQQGSTIQGPRRPQTAPNQLRAPRVQTTPYKRNTSSGQRQEATTQPNSQFKPNRQRAQSPGTNYNASNPYVQRQFKMKAWKK